MKYTDEQKEWIKNNCTGISIRNLTDLFNEKFNTNATIEQIRYYLRKHKMSTGFDGKFKKGNIPYNKGKKGLNKPNKTSFKKGNIPHNHRPVGSERINIDGYTEVKVAEPAKWVSKQRYIWEQNYGKIKPGYAVFFADGDKTNFNIDNLVLLSRREILMMTSKNLIQNDADLTKTGIMIANMLLKIKDKEREAKDE